MADASDYERRFAELERRIQVQEDLREQIAVLAERMRVTNENFVDWQRRQDAAVAEQTGVLRLVVEQTAESRGSLRTRKAIVAGAVVAITVGLGLLGGALNLLGVFG